MLCGYVQFFQTHQPRLCRRESAADIKTPQMWQEIDVQIVGTTFCRELCSALDKFCSQPLAAAVRMHRWIEQERMHITIAGDFDEADELAVLSRRDVEKAGAETDLEVVKCWKRRCNLPKCCEFCVGRKFVYRESEMTTDRHC